MASWIWVLIPLAAIMMGGYKEWLKFQSKQNRLGHSTRELEDTVHTLREALETSEKERERLTERIQNLETIVTSQSWDALHEGKDRDGLKDSPRSSLSAAPRDREEPGDIEKAEQLARQLKV